MDHYYWHHEACECCGQPPVIFCTCSSCHRLLGVCGEVDWVAYYFESTTRHPVSNLSIPESRPVACPFCDGHIHYSTLDDLVARGFDPGLLEKQRSSV